MGTMNSHFAELAKKEASLTDDGEPPSRQTYHSTNSKQDKPFLAGLITSLRKLLPFKQDATLKEAIEEVLEEHEEEDGELAGEERIILENVLAFGDITVGDIVIPRADIFAVEDTSSLDDLKTSFITHRHTRVPVYKENLDYIEGFLHIKDVFSVVAGDKPFDLDALLRPMLFVPPSMPVADLLVKMRKLSSHMAIVVDEYGGTDGLVTLEDVFEELVGDIQDEHDGEEENRSEIVRVSAHVVDVDARIEIEELQSELGLQLISEEEDEEADYETLGGFVFAELGRIPTASEIVKHPSGVHFEIIEADPRRILRIRIHHLP